MACFPADTYTRRELGWILYERLFKPALEKGDLAAAADAANQVLEMNPDGLALVQVVHGMMKLGKEKSSWQTVLDWSARVTPDLLDAKPSTSGDRKSMPKRAIWYIGRSRALYELKRYAEARELAIAGLAEFPEVVFLKRTAALALATSGDLIGGIAEMRSAVTGPGGDWYMKAELAEMLFKAESYAESYRVMCDSVSDRRQGLEYKVRYFAILARIALKLNKPRVAAEHVSLAKAIYDESGWNLSADVAQAEREVRGAYDAAGKAWPDLPAASDQLARLCAEHWRAGATEGVQFYAGTVKDYPEGRFFTYIRRDDGAGDVYAVVADMPAECRRPGSQVEFAIAASFDRKKGRESVRAVHIRRRESQ